MKNWMRGGARGKREKRGSYGRVRGVAEATTGAPSFHATAVSTSTPDTPPGHYTILLPEPANQQSHAKTAWGLRLRSAA